MPKRIASRSVKLNDKGQVRLSPDLCQTGDTVMASIFVRGENGKLHFSSLYKPGYSLKKIWYSNKSAKTGLVSVRQEVLRAGLDISEVSGEFEALPIEQYHFYINVKRRIGNGKEKSTRSKGTTETGKASQGKRSSPEED